MMDAFRIYFQKYRSLLPALIVGAAGLGWLVLYHLGSLAGGLSGGEAQAATAVYGWHGLYHQPLYLPLNAVRSVVFVLFQHHGQSLTRLPNALLGAGVIIAMAAVLRCWYGTRTAVLTAILFACGAWTLHVSRLASYDVLYLGSLPVLLLVQYALQRLPTKPIIFYSSLGVWLLALYIPGMVWLVVASLVWTWPAWLTGWKHFSQWWQRLLYGLLGLLTVSLLASYLTTLPHLRQWAGLPAHLGTPWVLLKHFAAVPVHLAVRGPADPALWLGRAPLLDIFTLAMALLGAYVYVRHVRSSRSRLLLSYFLIGWILVALGGPVALSLLVPLLYLCAAAGIAYLLRAWFRVFPLNPIARGLGLGLVTVAICASCGYNLRAYFVAWPHNPTTQATFSHRR